MLVHQNATAIFWLVLLYDYFVPVQFIERDNVDQ